jgi:uncharacterized protein YyaL (SSP411 family)
LNKSGSIRIGVLALCMLPAWADLTAADPPQETPLHTNGLADQTSPYLLQHVHNPVNWYPWGEEAFAKARREDKPIFLSVGYSTCHWCHVMERESFEDETVATMLNQHFVSIKVDREERPDVDELYMTAVQMMTGRGGWPMSVWLTTDLKPFHGGTYYPKDKFLQLLSGLAQSWQERRQEVEGMADRMAGALKQRSLTVTAARTLTDEPLERAVEQMAARLDRDNGGFGSQPKFPNETHLLFLLGRYERSGDPRALEIPVLTLEKMAAGGIYDQAGGGFHRYSVDASWQVPHFEKMLYNQAWLGRAYLEAARLTGRAEFERIVREILGYVLRDMTSPEGAFYTAEDADSEGEEGVFYAWTPGELVQVLGEEDAGLLGTFYGVTEQGNFEHGLSNLRVSVDAGSFAAAHEMSVDQWRARLEGMHGKLLVVRARRERPLRDDKVLAGWSGMMIGTFARAGLILDEPEYVEAARRAADYVLTTNRDPEGNLLRASRAGKARIGAFQEDYAYFVDGLLELYRASGEERWLQQARTLADTMIDLFYDADGEGGFFSTPANHANLLVRSKDSHDGAIPSGNAVAVDDLARLARFTGELRYREKAEGTLASFADPISRSPMAFSYMLFAADALRNGETGPSVSDLRGILAVRLHPDRAPLRPGAGVEGRLSLTIRPGWHINSNRPNEENLVATMLSGDGLDQGLSLDPVQFPQGEDIDLPFTEVPMSVYQGEVSIPFRLELAEGADGGTRLARLQLRYQACDDRKCLAPSEIALVLPLHVQEPGAAPAEK